MWPFAVVTDYQMAIISLNFPSSAPIESDLAIAKRGDLDTYGRPQSGAHVCTKLCKRGRTKVGSQLYMHPCTDSCTHSNQSFFWKKDYLLLITAHNHLSTR